MIERAVQEPVVVVTFPAYFLVRLTEVNDPATIVRNTLRLGSKGVTMGRQWFVPVFTTEVGASRFADEVRRIDDKLRVIAVHNNKEWTSLLLALHANGDAFAAFDPQPNHVQHVSIADLLNSARKRLSDNPLGGSSPRTSDPELGRSWLRSRLAAFLPTASADARARAAGGRGGAGAPPDETERVHPHLTPRNRPTNPRG